MEGCHPSEGRMGAMPASFRGLVESILSVLNLPGILEFPQQQWQPLTRPPNPGPGPGSRWNMGTGPGLRKGGLLPPHPPPWDQETLSFQDREPQMGWLCGDPRSLGGFTRAPRAQRATSGSTTPTGCG